jgi:hypothetical protein
MHENKIFFFCFLKEEINLKFFETFKFKFFLSGKFQRKPSILILNLYLTMQVYNPILCKIIGKCARAHKYF